VAEAVNDAELGRSKQSTSPADHLLHLLGLGWSPTSPLILKYVVDHNLQRELSEWQSVNVQIVTPSKTKQK
jgi:hypothetical protein